MQKRFWIEIIVLGSAIACAIALLIATLGAAAVGFAEPRSSLGSNQAIENPADGTKAYEGMVTCSRCGARHSANMGESAAACARRCVRHGATFALVNGDRTYLLEGNATQLRKVAGQRVHIVGVAHGDTISVSSIAPV